MVQKVAVSLIVCGVLAMATASCGINKDNPAAVVVVPAPDETVTHEFQPPVINKPQLPEYVWPLTGTEAPSATTNRPFMVMVNNAPQARPQSGLSYADVLFEVLAEGEITRLVAVYQSKHWDGPIGPVRSIRPYYINLGKMMDAVPVHAGGSPDAYTELSAQKLEHMDEITNAGPFFGGTLPVRRHIIYIPVWTISKPELGKWAFESSVRICRHRLHSWQKLLRKHMKTVLPELTLPFC